MECFNTSKTRHNHKLQFLSSRKGTAFVRGSRMSMWTTLEIIVFLFSWLPMPIFPFFLPSRTSLEMRCLCSFTDEYFRSRNELTYIPKRKKKRNKSMVWESLYSVPLPLTWMLSYKQVTFINGEYQPSERRASSFLTGLYLKLMKENKREIICISHFL